MYNRLITLRSSLEDELSQIACEEKNLLVKSKRSLNCLRSYCNEWSLSSMPLEFENKQEEISFFKDLKVFFFSRLYYYTDVFSIEAKRPHGEVEFKKKYFNGYLTKIQEHYQVNQHYYQYYHSGDTTYDTHYFLRINKYDLKHDQNGELTYCQDDYSSAYDQLFSRIVANNLLEKYLHEEMLKLDFPEMLTYPRKKVSWTDSKIALIEALYAIYETKSINHGKIELRELMETMGDFFEMDLSDYSKVYFELKNRTQRTRFVDQMRKQLISRMDKDEE